MLPAARLRSLRSAAAPSVAATARFGIILLVALPIGEFFVCVEGDLSYLRIHK